MRVIAVVALPGSGKSEAANVAEEMGIPVVTMGDVIRNACRERGLETTEDNMGAVATALREDGGDAAIAEASIPLIENYVESHDTVLVDGIRGIAEVNRFNDVFGDDFSLVSIDVPFETRLERIQTRGRDPTAEDAMALKRRDERELGYGMGEAMQEADFTIENTDSLDAFRTKITHVLQNQQVVEEP